MTLIADDIYKSENGDTWRLIRDSASGRAYVRHEANPSSGGHITELEIEEFLSRDGSGPEYAATLNLLGKPAQSQPRSGGPICDEVSGGGPQRSESVTSLNAADLDPRRTSRA